MPYLDVWCLLKWRHLLEGDAYFNVDTQSSAFIGGQPLFEILPLLEEIQTLLQRTAVSIRRYKKIFYLNHFIREII